VSFDADVILGLLPDAATCRLQATRLGQSYPGENPEALARRATQTAQRWAGASGAGMGLFGNPFLIAPAGIADMLVMIRIEAQLAGVVAALLDPPSLDDDDSRVADLLGVIFPGAVGEALGHDEPATKSRIRARVTKGVGKTALKFVAKYVGLQFAGRSLFSKAIPFVGALIGGTLNWLAVRDVGERAIRYHTETTTS
jgi:hypothetical protein